MSHRERESPREPIFSLCTITDADQAGRAIDRPVALSQRRTSAGRRLTAELWRRALRLLLCLRHSI